MHDAIHDQQERIEFEVARLAVLCGPGYTFEYLNGEAGKYLMLAAHVGELEIEGLEDDDDAREMAKLASADVEGNC